MAIPTPVVIQLKRLPHNPELPIPSYATAGAAAADFRAAIPADAPVILQPGTFAVIPTGFALAIPQGYEMQVRPRSGNAAKHGIGIVNSPGTIDADYRGELMIILVNHGQQPFTVNRGDRIAQMVIMPLPAVSYVEVDVLDETTRNTGGFGSTGRN